MREFILSSVLVDYDMYTFVTHVANPLVCFSYLLEIIVIACALTFDIMLLLLFCQFRTHKVIYRRYAGLFFSMCVDITDNELAYLECIHLFVEILDHFFSNVCELDLVFNFHKV